MSEIQFDEDSLSNASRIRQSQMGSSSADQPKMVRWMMDHKLASSPAVANIILVIAIVINVIITFLVINYLI